VTELGVQVDRARHGRGAKERSVTDRPGLALPDFDLGVGGEGGRGLLQTNPAQHSWILIDRARRGGDRQGALCTGFTLVRLNVLADDHHFSYIPPPLEKTQKMKDKTNW